LGLARFADNDRLLVGSLAISKLLGGSPYYASPELLREISGHQDFYRTPSLKSNDIYAIGVVICEMLTGKVAI
jgi:serine/threonine protein kinase